ncbi:MAG: hypothetical protein GYA48_02450 [Chloroflexi bacterium]|nr:hypothetical protein [Chloroflexota bacterium]
MQRCKLRQCRAACCLHGVWVGVLEAEKILQSAYQIIPYVPSSLQDPASWFEDAQEPDPFLPGGMAVHTRVLDNPKHWGGSACGFLRADHKCALQVAANAAGLHPWHFKPLYCILHPLDLDEQGRITLDQTSLLLDEPGSCLRPAPSPIPLWVTFEEELRYFLGDARYDELKNQLNKPS